MSVLPWRVPRAGKHWSVYLIRTGNGDLYTGVTTDVTRRVAEHRSGKGSRFLRGRGPLEVVYCRRIGERSLALRLEHALKRCNRTDKEAIVAARTSRKRLLAFFEITAPETYRRDVHEEARERSR